MNPDGPEERKPALSSDFSALHSKSKKWLAISRLSEFVAGFWNRRSSCKYVFGILVALAAVGVREAMGNNFGVTAPFVTFYPAVMVAAMIGGLGPGVVATTISAVAVASGLFEPPGAFQLADPVRAVQLAVFVFMGVGISALAEHAARARKTEQRELRRAARYSRNLIEASLDPLVTISREGKITDVNEATERVTGVARERLIGSDFCDYFTEPENARQGYQQAFAEGTVRDYPLAIRHVSGRITDVLYNAAVFKNRAGEIEGVFAAARDITARKRAEEALQQSKQRLDLAQKIGKIAAWEWNPADGAVIWSPEFETLYGLPPGGRRGTYEEWRQMVHPADIERIEAAVSQTITSKNFFQAEFRIIWPDQSVHWIAARGSATYDDRGQPLCMVGVNQDVTDRKSAEEALEQKAKELERSNEELAQFAYVASHDLQEPLRKIVAFGDRLAAHCSQVLDERGRDYLERMENAARRMGQLIESLLELSRLNTRGGVLQPVDLNEVVSEVLGDLEVLLQQSGGRVETEALPALQADRAQMSQLFQNLIGNALKFRRESVAPVVRIHGRQNESGTWEIHVTDNGIGFEEKYLDRIFRPFQRLHPKNVYEGSGMGLAICNKIVAGHGGEITAHSQPGIGSDFALTLPGAARKEVAREAKA